MAQRKFTILFVFTGIVVYNFVLGDYVPDGGLGIVGAALVGGLTGFLGALLDKHYAQKDAEPLPSSVPTASPIIDDQPQVSVPPPIPAEALELSGAAPSATAPMTAQPIGAAPTDRKAVIGLVCGVTSLFAWILPMAGIPISLIGLLSANRARQMAKSGLSLAGLVLCAIGLLLGGANGVAGAYLDEGASVFSLFGGDDGGGKNSVEEVRAKPSGPEVKIVDRTIDDERMKDPGWKSSRQQLSVSATMSTRNGTRAAVVNGEVVGVGDFIEVDHEGRTYRWTIASIHRNSVTWEPLDVLD